MWVLLITDNSKDIKGKSKALCLYWILKYDQAIPTALIPISSFTPEKFSLIFSVGFCCRTSCSVYWLKVTIYLGHSSLPCITGQLAGELVARWSGMVSCMCLQVGSGQFGCLILLWVASRPPQAGWLTLMLVSGLQAHWERTVGDIQVSPCVMCANVLLVKAGHVAKLIVSVEGNY